MSAFRSRMRLVAMAWLLCQVASLSAFVPEDCCDKHTAMAAASHHPDDATPPCHETEAAPAPEPEPGAACPMHHDEGAACPMHRAPSGECCGISNGCDGPNQPLSHLFAFAGVLAAPVTAMSAPVASLAPVPSAAPLLHRLVTPDAPPPKA